MQIRWVSIDNFNFSQNLKLIAITIHLIDETNNKTINNLMMSLINFSFDLYEYSRATHTHAHFDFLKDDVIDTAKHI